MARFDPQQVLHDVAWESVQPGMVRSKGWEEKITEKREERREKRGERREERGERREERGEMISLSLRLGRGPVGISSSSRDLLPSVLCCLSSALSRLSSALSR